MLKTILIIFEQFFLYFPLILGAYISISLMKLPNLSIESAFVFGAISASKVALTFNTISTPVSIFLTIIFSILGGLFVGLCSGLLTQIAKIPHLLSSIITIGLFHGINLFILSKPNQTLSEKQNFLEIFNFLETNPELIMLLIIFVITCLIFFLVLKTELGYSFAIYGNNPEFFKNHGTSTNFVVITGLLISNSLAGFSGYLVAQSNGFVDIHMGVGIALFCITSLVLGKNIFKIKKNISILIPTLGIISYCTIQQILLKIGLNLKYFTMIQAIIILGILIFNLQDNKVIKVDNLGV